MKKRLILYLMPALIVGVLYAGMTYSNRVINKTAAAIAFTETIDLEDWSRFSLQAIYTPGTPSSATIIDGQFAAANFTISTHTFARSRASVYVCIQTTTTITGDTLTANGIKFVEGTDWTGVGQTTTTAATNLATILNAHHAFYATSSGSTVTLSSQDYDENANGWPVTVSDATTMLLSAATMTGAVRQHTINIGGTVLTEGVDFNAETSHVTTAGNIATAIETVFSGILVATNNTVNNIVYSTSVLPGSAYNYYVAASTSSIAVSAGGFIGGIDSDIIASTFTETGHTFTDGLAVLMAVSAGTAPQGLADQATYYAINLWNNTFALATSTTNAAAGTSIQVSTFTGGGTFTFTPLSFSGTPTFRWQASNDNSNWYNLDSTLSSFTYTAAGNTLWDVGEVDYKYIRINYVAPTAGGLNLQVYMAGKKD